MRSPANIKRAIRELRKLIDSTQDPIERDMAYEVECALIWATDKTVRWWRPADSVRNMIWLRTKEGSK